MKRFIKQPYFGIFLVATIAGIALIFLFIMPNVRSVEGSEAFYVPTGTSTEAMIDQLDKEDRLVSHFTFRLVSKIFLTDKVARSGKYMLHSGMNNLKLIMALRSGRQTPVSLTFNNVRLAEELAGKISSYIEPDSQSVVTKMKDPLFCAQYGLDTFNIMSLFIPNTYQIYWNTSVDKFFEKMEEEHKKFWKMDNREAKADSLGLSKAEVYTLASIVEKETLINAEKPDVAGVYLNRLNKDMRLQADPTIVFATRNWELKRVLHGHLTFESPYNTYLNKGLPPGPICMPEISSIDAVLNATYHDYIYFCAKPGGDGAHAFASTFEEHVQLAKSYRQWVDKLEDQNK
ncbi:MAG TPA: endolytic transglycosylase MltG [Saprospiraceae bacterium]|nr:endolytic transglycosylase MltG [Saprospiraceae bacterium]